MMNHRHPGTGSSAFGDEYRELELNTDADWDALRTSYRRLVNIWHPDRRAQQAAGSEEAEARFIRLTRAFDSLRQYYRENNRLPLQPIADTAELANDRTERLREAQVRTESVAPAEIDVAGTTLFSNEPQAPDEATRKRRSATFWVIPGLLVVAGTLATVYVFDRNQKRETYSEGREVLRGTAPSEYMPSSSEVRRQSTRGSFIQRDDSGKLGDQLMPNVFK